MTFNGSWGYMPYAPAEDWRSVRKVLDMLRQVTSGGGNLLLNIGPAPDGSVPPEATERLVPVGKWLAKYGDAVYGTVDRTDGCFEWGPLGQWTRKGRFPRQPDLLYRTKIEVEGMKPSRSAAVIRFFGDATGDGVRDLLLRDSASRIKVLMARANRNGMQIISKPIFELRIDPKAGIRFGPSRGKRKAPDLVILESEQVLHVRFP